MKTIAIVAGGMPPNSTPKADGYIGVDRGALWLLRWGITPDIAIGDFDSVTKREKKYIHDHVTQYIEYPPKKDETDLELAIDEAIRLKPKEVRIYGSLGRRLDHSLTAVNLLLKLESYNIYGEIVDNFSKIQIVRRKLTLKKDAAYPYISIIPFGLDATVTLRGFAYNVIRKIFHRNSSLGISNTITQSSATITVNKGLVLVIQSRD